MRFRFGIVVSIGALVLGAPTAYAQIDPTGSLTGNDTGQQTVSATPSPVDLLVDSDSYVPPFYRGRTLPSAGTYIRLQAIPYFKNSNGSYIPASSILFTWKQDDRVIGNLSGVGKSSAVLPAAILYGTSAIEVDAQSLDNSQFGTATAQVPSIDPILLLYQDSPLLGIMYHHALGSDTSIPEGEMTFSAVPYFAQAQSPNDRRLIYAWMVNGSSIQASAVDPSEITLNSAKSNGIATIDLGLTHTTNFFMNSTGSWNIALGRTGSYGSGNTAGARDPFTGKSQ